MTDYILANVNRFSELVTPGSSRSPCHSKCSGFHRWQKHLPSSCVLQLNLSATTLEVIRFEARTVHGVVASVSSTWTVCKRQRERETL